MPFCTGEVRYEATFTPHCLFAGRNTSCVATTGQECQPGTTLKSVGPHGRTECVEGNFTTDIHSQSMEKNVTTLLHNRHQSLAQESHDSL